MKSGKKSILLIGYHDDLDLHRLADVLREMNFQVVTFLLGNDSKQYAISWDLKQMPVLFHESEKVSEDEMARADIIFSKWWRFDSPPLVKFKWADLDSQAFGESEWSGSICSALLAFYDNFRQKWIGSPAPGASRNTRLFLLHKAVNFGFHVPSSIINTTVAELDNSVEWVAKPISENEKIAEDRYFYTSRIGRNSVSTILGKRSECPSFIQQRIQSESEIRVFYIGGEVLSLKLKGPEPGWEDIRSILDQVCVSPANLESAWDTQIKSLMRETDISYCALDFLVNSFGDFSLVDITPDASWSAYEPEGPFCVTEGVANKLVLSSK